MMREECSGTYVRAHCAGAVTMSEGRRDGGKEGRSAEVDGGIAKRC